MRILIFLVILSICVLGNSQINSGFPISTQMTLKKAGNYNKDNDILKVFLIYNAKESSKGSGFLLKSGHIITNNHVIKYATCKDIIAISPDGKQHKFKNIISDSIRDLAILFPEELFTGGFQLQSDDSAFVGNQVYTWGYPLGYDGPSPLLSVGYIAGFNELIVNGNNRNRVQHIVVNGALNPGNSGGPLIDILGKVVGIVQSKHAPITPYLLSALDALKKNESGVGYSSTDEFGNKKNFSESQVLAEILTYYRELAQVMIGEAVTIKELKKFLKENNIEDF